MRKRWRGRGSKTPMRNFADAAVTGEGKGGGSARDLKKKEARYMNFITGYCISISINPRELLLASPLFTNYTP
jgi:hypothetical protein